MSYFYWFRVFYWNRDCCANDEIELLPERAFARVRNKLMKQIAIDPNTHTFTTKNETNVPNTQKIF